jgi:hypothetical protein
MGCNVTQWYADEVIDYSFLSLKERITEQVRNDDAMKYCCWYPTKDFY